MEVTIGRVMSFAARAGLPKPSRAYPAMALGRVSDAITSGLGVYRLCPLGTRTSPIAITALLW